MKKIFIKFLFLSMLIVGTVATSFGYLTSNANKSFCPYKDPHTCCVWACLHDPGSGCGSSQQCCDNACT